MRRSPPADPVGARSSPGGWPRFIPWLVIPIAGLLAIAAAPCFLARQPSRWSNDRTPPPGFVAALDEFAAGRTEEGLARLAQVRRRWRHPEWNLRCDFLAGYWSSRMQLLEPAVAHLSRGASRPPAGPSKYHLSAHAASQLGSLLARLGRHDQAASVLEPFAAHFERTVVGEDILETWASSAAASGRRQAAVSRVREALRRRDLVSPERIHVLSGRLAQSAGDTSGAAAIFKQVYCRFPQTAAAARAGELLDALPPPAGRWSRADLPLLIERAATLRAASDFKGVSQTWSMARERIPGGAQDREIACRLAIALVDEGRHEEAMREFASPRLRFYRPPGADLARETALAKARVALSRGRLAEARQVLAPLLSASAPRASRAAASLLLAERADRSGRAGEALRLYRQALPLMPPSLQADQAAWRAGWIAYKAGAVAEALSAFRRLQRPDCSRSLQAASLYWSARAQESHRRPAEARSMLLTVVERFRNDYYGVRAAARLRIGPSPSAHPASSRQAPAPAAETPAGADSGPPPDPGRFTGAAREAVETARELESLRLDEEASQAYEFALRHAPGDTGLNLRLADLALRRGDRTGALPYLRAAYPTLLSMNQATLPRSHKEALYPLGEWTEIARASARRSLDPYLVCALILQESAFNPLAVSRAGAIGLMQIMPETGREVATLTRVRPPRREDLFQASTNISLGTAHFSGLLTRYKGRLEPALAAYNAGDGRVSRWWAASRGDAETFVEDIPFTETRLYVKRIVANHRVYRLLYGS